MLFVAVSTEDNEGNIAFQCFTLIFHGSKNSYIGEINTLDIIFLRNDFIIFFKANNEITKRTA